MDISRGGDQNIRFCRIACFPRWPAYFTQYRHIKRI